MYIRSVNVSNIEYIAFNIETTSIGVILLQISVNVTTSENNIETLLNIFTIDNKEEKNIENHLVKRPHVLNWFYYFTGVYRVLAPSKPVCYLLWYHLIQ